MIDAIIKRASCRNFQNRQVDDSQLSDILKAAQYAPTGRNWRGWEFIIVKDDQIKKKIALISHERFPLVAPIFIVPVIDITSSFCPIEDISVASSFIMLQAKDCGLDSIWVEIIESEEENIKKILKVPDHYLLINIILIGYCVDKLPSHTEEEFDEKKIHFDYFK